MRSARRAARSTAAPRLGHAGGPRRRGARHLHADGDRRGLAWLRRGQRHGFDQDPQPAAGLQGRDAARRRSRRPSRSTPDCTGAGPVTVAAGRRRTRHRRGRSPARCATRPPRGYVGTDEFTYTTTNEGGASNTAKVTVKVLNPPQVCKDVSGTTPFQTAITLNTDCTGSGPATVAATDGRARHRHDRRRRAALHARGRLRGHRRVHLHDHQRGRRVQHRQGDRQGPRAAAGLQGRLRHHAVPDRDHASTPTAPAPARHGHRDQRRPRHRRDRRGRPALHARGRLHRHRRVHLHDHQRRRRLQQRQGDGQGPRAAAGVQGREPARRRTRPRSTSRRLHRRRPVRSPRPRARHRRPWPRASCATRPPSGFIGTDEFTYTVTNEGGTSNAATATVRVLAPPPVCKDVAATTPYETAVDIDIDCDRAGGFAIASRRPPTASPACAKASCATRPTPASTAPTSSPTR